MTHILHLKRLPNTYAPLLMPLILSFAMSAIVSGASLAINSGFALTALQAWPRAWAVSWIVAFPTLLLLLPLARRIVSRIVEGPK